jgi:hypothetical protein
MTALQAFPGINPELGTRRDAALNRNLINRKRGEGGQDQYGWLHCSRSGLGPSFGTHQQCAKCRINRARGGSPRLEARGSHQMQHRAFCVGYCMQQPHLTTHPEASQAAVPRSSLAPIPSHHLIPCPKGDRQSAIETDI